MQLFVFDNTMFVTFLNSCIFQTLCYNADIGDNMADTFDSKSDTTKEFIKEIRDAFASQREALGLNVRELGAKADVSYTVIYDLEGNNKLPKVETLIKLAEALNYSVTVKKATDEESGTNAISIVFHKGNINGKKFLYDQTPNKQKLSTDEQLKKVLNLKGLYADEIAEIESYIAFKLSNHK